MAQNFEGKIVLEQKNKGAEAVKITWYVQQERVALDIDVKTPDGKMNTLRFVPLLDKKMLLLTNTSNTMRYEIPLHEIKADALLKDGISARALSETVTEPRFGQAASLEIKTATTTTLANYTSDIAIDWTVFSDYFKSDFAVAALAQLRTKGFPFHSVTKDNFGNILSETTLLSVEKMPLDKKIFN